MVKIVKYCLAFSLIFAFAAPAFAQDDYPKFQLTPGYGNIGFKNPVLQSFFGIAPGRHSGFTLDTNYNLNSKLGVDLFTGYYSLGNNANLYTNTFGMTASLRKSTRIVPYGTAGFGFGVFSISSGSDQAMATRLGGGVDISLGDSMAIRVDATRMGFHFFKSWNSGANYSVGLVLNLSQ